MRFFLSSFFVCAVFFSSFFIGVIDVHASVVDQYWIGPNAYPSIYYYGNSGSVGDTQSVLGPRILLSENVVGVPLTLTLYDTTDCTDDGSATPFSATGTAVGWSDDVAYNATNTPPEVFNINSMYLEGGDTPYCISILSGHDWAMAYGGVVESTPSTPVPPVSSSSAPYLSSFLNDYAPLLWILGALFLLLAIFKVSYDVWSGGWSIMSKYE